MNHQYQTPLYYHQHQGYPTTDTYQSQHSMVLPQPLKLFNGKSNNNHTLSSFSSLSTNDRQHENISMLNKHYHHPTLIQANRKSCETIIPIYNHHQPWKLGRTTNELMLSNEIIVPSLSPSPLTTHQYSIESHGLSIDSTSASTYDHLLNHNTYYSSPPPLSVSSSSSTSIYDNSNHYEGNTLSNNYNGLLYLSDSNYHCRRSSINTSRSSSPSTSSYATPPYQDSANSRSPSPAAASKRYACRLCNKRFTRPSSLTTHIYSHTGEKPFKCHVKGCGRHFSVVSNLRRHAKVHGNVNLKSSGSSTTARSF